MRGTVVSLVSVSVLVGSLGAFYFLRDQPSELPARGAEKLPTGPRVVAPLPPRAVPDDLVGYFEEIQSAQRESRFEDAAQRYYELLRLLAGRWGDQSPDLAPYYYNFAFCLRLAGRAADSESVVVEARKRWPGYLQLQILDVTQRADAALATGRLDPELERLYDEILRPANLPRLRGYRVAPELLLAQRAEILLRAGRVADARAAVDQALALAPEHRLSRRLLARVLVAEENLVEARPLLEELATNADDPELALLLGKTLVDSGEPREALRWLLPLFERVRAGGGSTGSGGTGSNETGSTEAEREAILSALRLPTARAHLECGERESAIALLLDAIAADPRETGALHLLARFAREGGLHDLGAALSRRVESLRAYEVFDRLRRGADRAGKVSSVAYYRAAMALEVHDLGTALAELDSAVKISTGIAQIWIERIAAHERLGRIDQAARVAKEALDASGSALFVVELARLAAIEGRAEDSRRGLADERLILPSLEAQEELSEVQRGELAFVVARRLRTYLELGESVAARDFFRRYRITNQDPPELLLVRAELALLERRVADAESLLAESYDAVPGAAIWQRALRVLLELGKPAKDRDAELLARVDPSDLLDHPRLLVQPEYARYLDEAARDRLAAWATLRVNAQERLAVLRGFGAADVIDRWEALLELHLEAGARRKALEVAWYLRSIEPRRVASYVRLDRTLRAVEEIAERWAVVVEGLRIDRENESLRASHGEIRAAFGLAEARDGARDS